VQLTQPLGRRRERRRRPLEMHHEPQFIFGRTAVSPKIERMSSTPRPRTSRKSFSIAGQRPSSCSCPMREISTTSSATSPWPRLMSSNPSSLLPTPESPVISTPRPSTSMNTPWRVVVSASVLER
jgi:hypothetical protein